MNDEPPKTNVTAERPSAKSWAAQSKELLEVSGKTLIGIAGLCYVNGLIVVTIHLRQYGLNSLDLPQLHYVTAGVWTLLPIVLLVLMIAFGIFVMLQQLDEVKNKKGVDKILAFGALIPGVILICYLILRYFGSKIGIQFGWINWFFIPLLGLFVVACLVVAPILFRSALSDRRLMLSLIATTVVGIVSAFFYVTLFATRTYDDIPWSTGGGRPSHVRLVVAADSKPFLESVGIPFSGSPSETDVVKLLLATEKQLVVVNSGEQAVGVPSDMVKLVVYEK